MYIPRSLYVGMFQAGCKVCNSNLYLFILY